jgi:two-component system NtrC family sensor kinase
VLLIDDERAVADSLKQALHDDFCVETAGSAREARARLDAGQTFDVVLCDLTMPEETGAEFFEQLKTQHPALCSRFAFMSGGVWNANTSEFVARSGCPHVEKPFSLDDLRRLLNALIAKAR